ncbi:hypothetical protein FNF27_05509 [Cafeteria roenbergensis]|uniref:2'-phosphotransferase n=1 Tax=Cafeteria roenbergensis TaxID=33653 RepID=A0A5A8DR36_CAFRO|nr:hypothetical protein FNF31_01457 [Cafeteria roenbergensis]KAA0169560.1 hypothetical protein FNF28_02004 [Cafeteria roenbergensis]KAA0173018.1 hypothetical protein FNF27_05509 [Cafeteria roenbergensis]
MSSILRHRAAAVGLALTKDGFAVVEALLAVPSMAKLGATVRDVRTTVERDEKSRYTLETRDGVLMVRANQGHSIKHIDDSSMLRAVASAAELPICYHGTSAGVLPLVLRPGGGLSRMTRRSAGRFPDVYIVLDFEATCVRGGRLSPQEVIELPSVALDARTGAVLSEFRSYVRPLHHPRLSEFCTELTGIEQPTVDAAPAWPEACAAWEAWVSEQGWTPAVGGAASSAEPAGAGPGAPEDSMSPAASFDWSFSGEGAVSGTSSAGTSRTRLRRPGTAVLVTCGDWDIKTMLPAQAAASPAAPVPQLMRSWINIKRTVAGRHGAAAARGMPSMLKFAGLPQRGRHHSGLDDCRNIGAVLSFLIGRGQAPTLSEARTRLRDRKNALNRLALEDALGKETEEQAKSESSVLSTMGGAPFLGVDEQKAKLSAYAADAADALERARRIKEQAEEASSEAASVAVLTVARAPEEAPLDAERRKRAAVLAAASPQDRATVQGLLEQVDQEDVAREVQREEARSAAAKGERARIGEESLRMAEEAARRGPQAVNLLAMQQMWDDLRRVRKLSEPRSAEESAALSDEQQGKERVVGPVAGAVADAMGWTAAAQ